MANFTPGLSVIDFWNGHREPGLNRDSLVRNAKCVRIMRTMIREVVPINKIPNYRVLKDKGKRLPKDFRSYEGPPSSRKEDFFILIQLLWFLSIWTFS